MGEKKKNLALLLRGKKNNCMTDLTYFVMSRKREDNLEVILCTEHKISTFAVIDFVLLYRERAVVEKD